MVQVFSYETDGQRGGDDVSKKTEEVVAQDGEVLLGWQWDGEGRQTTTVAKMDETGEYRIWNRFGNGKNDLVPSFNGIRNRDIDALIAEYHGPSDAPLDQPEV